MSEDRDNSDLAKGLIADANAKLLNTAAIDLLTRYEAMRTTFGAETAFEVVTELYKVAKRMAELERKNKIWTPGDPQ